uniref:Molybdopterin dehydrogenase FAD-binding domain-containing protein n=1 Tax=Parascaris univalens TaxID=6257 RepID=A0A915AY31_PARUN
MTKDGVTWFQPVSLADLLALKAHYPKAEIVCGNTELGVELKFQFSGVSTYINSKQRIDGISNQCKRCYIGSVASSSTQTGGKANL